MKLGNIDIESITANDVVALRDNDVRESTNLEYKLNFPEETRKTDFAVDVAAMANCGGGFILYGIEEKREGQQKTGAIESFPGVGTTALDSLISKYANIARAHVKPVISDLTFKPIKLSPDLYVVAVHVPKTYDGPHFSTSNMVFYSRHSSGNYRMELSEIRSAFIARSTAREEAMNWTVKQLAWITEGKAPIPLRVANTVPSVLHIVPWYAFSGADLLDVDQMYEQRTNFQPMTTTRGVSKFNAKGLLLLDRADAAVAGYTQVFRTGQLGSVDVYSIPSDAPTIHCFDFENNIREHIKAYLGGLRALGIIPPITIVLNIINATGLKILMPEHHIRYHQDEPSLNYNSDSFITAVSRRLDGWDSLDVDYLIKPMFDTLWIACGWRSSPNFTDGVWTPSK
ncbi:MAG TPA: ATP-binding protein [Drouetiella sp.]